MPLAVERSGDAELPVLPPEVVPDYDAFVTEDDTPVDSLFAEKQQALLKDPLVSSWKGPGDDRPFQSFVNVGLFYAIDRPPLVPDFMLSFDVRAPVDLHLKQNRSYFVWVFGKAPNVVLEIVSDQPAGEDDTKMASYAQIGIPLYVIFDPLNRLGPDTLRVYGLTRGSYRPVAANWLPEANLGLTFWEGTYDGCQAVWLRWCDRDGHVLPTGRERAEAAEESTAQERRRAEQLAQRLRELGAEP